ncbi:MAG: hypothetical protein A2041_09600 [Bacteroidetes bacterium GWA2_31_9b]|nr:MAG: hypothetical protein A2041_09600 [Bacteroidetes bacterium GWA2_31_9b]
MEHLISAIDNNDSLPYNSVLLTFDDAYIDHFTNVFPILFNRKIQGSFYVPASNIMDNLVLDVNKIHFILASVIDMKQLIRRTFKELNKYRNDYNLSSNEYYFEKLAIPSRMDNKEVVFFKRLLQKELPETLRRIITDNLFREFVDINESTFSKELYMTKEQITCMVKNGMHIGNHGFEHVWLDTLSEDKQKEEIAKGCNFLKEMGVDMNNWTMSYPYGAYDQSLINILKDKGCKLAFTANVEIADLNKNNRFELPRLDTNDLPKSSK